METFTPFLFHLERKIMCLFELAAFRPLEAAPYIVRYEKTSAGVSYLDKETIESRLRTLGGSPNDKQSPCSSAEVTHGRDPPLCCDACSRSAAAAPAVSLTEVSGSGPRTFCEPKPSQAGGRSPHQVPSPPLCSTLPVRTPPG